MCVARDGISFVCPHCKARYCLPGSFLGFAIACEECGELFTLNADPAAPGMAKPEAPLLPKRRTEPGAPRLTPKRPWRKARPRQTPPLPEEQM